MKCETKNMALPVVHVPDAVAARVTREAASDPRWKTWKCPGCGNIEAGYRTNTNRVACAHCVMRIREGKAIGLTPEELWEESLADEAAARLCGVCGEEVGETAEALGGGQSVICRDCINGAAA